MANRSLELTDQVYDYLLEVSLREHPVLARLREETAELPLSIMQIAPEQGQFMRLLVQILGAKRCLEIGIFTGYSSLSVALGLPADGQIIACDVSVDFTEIALRYWAEAGVADKIDLRLGPAIQTLDDLLNEGASESFDFAFIDADKENYLPYYERCLKLIRPGGLIAVDNVLWNGSVADPEKTDADTLAIRELNEKLRDDERVDISMVPIGDGLTLARKR
jgi:predicted O-methyltransferase YrrM